jgi:hypothetical protein
VQGKFYVYFGIDWHNKRELMEGGANDANVEWNANANGGNCHEFLGAVGASGGKKATKWNG